MTKPKPLPKSKKCPCGADAVLHDWGLGSYPWHLICLACGKSSDFRKTPRGAILAWNRMVKT